MYALDHVALVVRSIEEAVERLQLEVDLGAIDTFPAEGTRELYVGEPSQAGKLLLMQPTGDNGPYARALKKRGEGLHHIAFCVPDVRAYVGSVAETGWLLHPRSLEELERCGTVWLCRPGVRSLVELTARKPNYEGTPVVTEVGIPSTTDLSALVGALGVSGVQSSSAERASITIRAVTHSL